MKIYYEEIFLLNFLLDFMILYGTKRILKINKSIIRIIFGSILGSFTTILLFYNISGFSLLFIKIILSIFMIISSFGFKNIFKNTLYFYLISIIIGGFFYLFELNSNVIVIHTLLVIGSFIIIKIICFEVNNYKEKYSNKYLVDIYIMGRCYKLEGFIDTGNRLVSNINNKVIILTNLSINTNKLLYVPYKALNCSGVIPCVKPDKVIINNISFNDCLIGLSSNKFNLEYSCILPNKYKEELC